MTWETNKTPILGLPCDPPKKARRVEAWFHVPLPRLDAATRDGRLTWVKWFEARRKRVGVRNRAGRVYRLKLNRGAFLRLERVGATWDCDAPEGSILDAEKQS